MENGKTLMKHFRLDPGTVKKIEEIAVWMSNRDGTPRNRTDALRAAVDLMHQNISRKKAKNRDCT